MSESDQYLREARGPFNGADRALLARVDERTKHLLDVQKNYVTKEQMKPIITLAYGLTGTILLAVVGAVVKIVVIDPTRIPQ